LTFKCI